MVAIPQYAADEKSGEHKEERNASASEVDCLSDQPQWQQGKLSSAAIVIDEYRRGGTTSHAIKRRNMPAKLIILPIFALQMPPLVFDYPNPSA
jgi:hypothetical protein